MPLSALDQRILTLLADAQPRSTGQIAAAMGVDPYGMRDVLARLKASHHVTQLGTRYGQSPARGGWQPGRHLQQAVWTLPKEV